MQRPPVPDPFHDDPVQPEAAQPDPALSDAARPDAAAPGPPVPSAAERARTVAARGGSPALLPVSGRPAPSTGDAESERLAPDLHHVFANGSAALLFPDDHPLVIAALVARPGELTVALELTDTAPVSLREPVRGLLWITGWLRALTGEAARADAIAVADEHPDPRLLDVGHGATLIRLVPLSVVIADAEGSVAVPPADFAAAEPDPFCRLESGWLRHVESTHPDVVGLLSRHLPAHVRGGHIRPLGLDRFGLRLRVEGVGGDHDIRLAFSRSVRTAGELAIEFRRLLGCPFRASSRPA